MLHCRGVLKQNEGIKNLCRGALPTNRGALLHGRGVFWYNRGDNNFYRLDNFKNTGDFTSLQGRFASLQGRLAFLQGCKAFLQGSNLTLKPLKNEIRRLGSQSFSVKICNIFYNARLILAVFLLTPNSLSPKNAIPILIGCFLPQSFAKYFAEQRKENSAQLCGKTFSQNSVLNIGDLSDSFLAFETITYSTFVCACFHNPLGNKWIERVGEGRR